MYVSPSKIAQCHRFELFFSGKMMTYLLRLLALGVFQEKIYTMQHFPDFQRNQWGGYF